MARGVMIKNMAAVMMLMLINGTASKTLTVGDVSGWIRPAFSDFYSSWAAKHIFDAGDILEFNFSTGNHTVVMVTSKDAYDKCDPTLDKNPKEFKTGPARIPLTIVGEVLFFCTINCLLDQELAINVLSADAKNSLSLPESHQDTGSAPKSMALTLSTFGLSLVAHVMVLGYY